MRKAGGKSNGMIGAYEKRARSPFVSTQSAAVVLPAEFQMQLDRHRSARVTTRKLPGSPNHLYSVYYGDQTHPVLELISHPDKSDVINAIARRKA